MFQLKLTHPSGPLSLLVKHYRRPIINIHARQNFYSWYDEVKWDHSFIISGEILVYSYSSLSALITGNKRPNEGLGTTGTRMSLDNEDSHGACWKNKKTFNTGSNVGRMAVRRRPDSGRTSKSQPCTVDIVSRTTGPIAADQSLC